MMRLFNSDVAVLNAWTPENPNTSMPRAINADPNNNARTSDRFIEDGSYMRIKNLTIGYNFSNQFLSRMFADYVKGLKFYATAQNLLTLTNYYGYDPEIALVAVTPCNMVLIMDNILNHVPLFWELRPLSNVFKIIKNKNYETKIYIFNSYCRPVGFILR